MCVYVCVFVSMLLIVDNCVCIYICMSVCVCVCACDLEMLRLHRPRSDVCVCVHMCMRLKDGYTCIPAFIHSYIHTRVYACNKRQMYGKTLHTYIHTHIHTYIHTYIHTDIHTRRQRKSLLMCRKILHIYIYIYIYTHTYIRADNERACRCAEKS